MSTSETHPVGTEAPRVAAEAAAEHPPTPSQRELDSLLTAFFATGAVPGQSPVSPGHSQRLPARLAAYQDPGLRGPFPLVLDPESGRLDSLTQVIDGVVQGLESGDSGQIRSRILLKLDRLLRTNPAGLDETWARLAEQLPAEWRGEADQVRPLVDRALGSAEILPFGQAALQRVVELEALTTWRTSAQSWIAEAAELVQGLSGLEEVDRDEAEHPPDKLQQSTGGAFADAFDFSAMSKLLDRAPHLASLPKERRERLAKASTVLRELPEVLQDSRHAGMVSLMEAESAMQERMSQAAELGRAMMMARLETSNRFNAERHQAILSGLGFEFFPDEERSKIPPVVTWARETDLSDQALGAIGRLLVSQAPYKVILELSSVPDQPGSRGWELVGQAMAAVDTFVLQMPLSILAASQEDIRDAMRHPGPALIAVFAPREYLTAAAALESRAVPYFRCAAARSRWSTRCSVDLNPEAEADWAGLDQSNEQPCFTWADHALLIPDLASSFMVIPDQWKSDRLWSMERFLAATESERVGHIPVLSLDATDGLPRRAVPSALIVQLAEQALVRWQRLAELAGSRNSYAEAAAVRLREAHREELERALAEAKADHEQAFAVAVDGLAREIVSNIAASLLGQGGHEGFAASPSAAGLGGSASGLAGKAAHTPGGGTPAAAPDKTTESQAAPAPAEPAPAPAPEEDDLILDEAWIETVRCTSCNECTNLNGMLFAYDENKQAYIKDPAGGPFRDLVVAAEKCPAAIIHPGKPLNPDEPHLQELVERAKRFL